MRGRARGIEKRIQFRIIFRRARVGLIAERVPIQVDVVLIYPAKPRHSVRIEDMDKNQSGASRNAWKLAERLNLNGRTGESFHTVKTRSMQYHAPGFRIA